MRMAAFIGAGLVLGVAGYWAWQRRQPFASYVEYPDASDDGPPAGTVDDSDEIMSAGKWTPPASAAPYLADIAAAEARYNIPSMMLARLLYQESHFRADIISGKTKSSVGALGIAQFMPATAAELGIDPLNPTQAIDAAGKYLSRLYMSLGDWKSALAAYNWGQGNVKRKGLASAPQETQRYFTQILSDLGLA